MDERPTDLPELNDILTEVVQWITSVTTGRIHFYSAREEPAAPPVPPKKGTQKRITNNQIAEQLAALAAQVQVLATQQEILQKNQTAGSKAPATTFAGAAGDPSLGVHVTPKIPALSSTLVASGPSAVQKVSAMVGPPPKVRAPVNLVGSTARRVKLVAWSACRASRDAEHRLSDIPAEPGHHSLGITSDLRRRYCRSTDWRIRRSFHEYQRRRQTRENAVRPCQQNDQFLPPSRATAVQEDVSSQGSSFHFGRNLNVGCLDDFLCREVSAGPWTDFLDSEPCYGCCCIQRLRSHTGVLGDPDGMFGAVCHGWQLECCLCAELAGGASSSALHGEDVTRRCGVKAICAASTACMGGHSPVVPERGRALVNQEGRDPGQSPAFTKGRRGTDRNPEAAAKVPEKAVGGCTVEWPKAQGITPESSQGSMQGLPHQMHSLGRPPKIKGDRHNPRASSGNLGDPVGSRNNPHASRIDMEVSYPKWCAMLVSLVLKTRTPFAAFVARSIRLSRLPRRPEVSTPAFFPIPLPLAIWSRMPEKCSAKKRHSIHLSRATFVIIAALNFWHSGGKVCDEDIFWRVPNASHRRLYQKVRDLIKSDGPATSFSLPKAGRRFPELVSRLDELSVFLTAIGVSSNPYEKSFAGAEIPKDDSAMPELQPFSDLNPDRLVLHGTGSWDISIVTFLIVS